jgi:hypothetical protein
MSGILVESYERTAMPETSTVTVLAERTTKS